jgi:hypothetical protein
VTLLLRYDGARAAGTAPVMTLLLRHDEPELELIQPQVAQKPVLRGEVGARALRHDGARAAGTAPAVSLLLRHDGARAACITPVVTSFSGAVGLGV